VHPEEEPAHQDRHDVRDRADKDAGGDEAQPRLLEPAHEVGSRGERRRREEGREADRVEQPGRRLGQAREPPVHRAEPAEDEPAEQDADALAEPDVELPTVKAGMPMRPPRNTAAPTPTMSVTSVDRSA